VSAFGEEKIPGPISPDEAEQPVIDLLETYQNLSARNALESYHDAQQALDMAMNLFTGGYLPLEQRCQAENLYWAILVKLKKLVAQMDDVPEDLQALDDAMADTYFCNFSLFQSIPDSWAIKQLFPVMPIHNLNRRPSHHAVLGDITCDSDGKIDSFIDRRDVKKTLPLPHGERRARTTSACSSSAPTRRSSATCTTCSATRTPCHVSLDEHGSVVLDAVIKGTRSARCSTTSSSTPRCSVRKLRTTSRLPSAEGRVTYEESGRLLSSTRGLPRVYLPGRTPRSVADPGSWIP
jgi:arginine decarboxylase